MNRLILASASPRRQTLLAQIGIQPLVQPADIDEQMYPGEAPADYCVRMAEEKARTGDQRQTGTLPVLGADTVVVSNGKSLGKPQDVASARQMLLQLCGQQHQVQTAVSVLYQGQQKTSLVTSQVQFEQFPKAWIDTYIATDEPMDKAGAYAIQGGMAMWISHISGSYSAIMGLPLYETAQILLKLGIIDPLTGG